MDFKITKIGTSTLQPRKSDGRLQYVLEYDGSVYSTIELPDCPDSDPYQIKIERLLLPTTNLLDVCAKMLPLGEYFIVEREPPETSCYAFSGNVFVNSDDHIRAFVCSDDYRCIGIVGNESSFRGAIFLAIVFPDFIIHEKPHGVFLVQISMDSSARCSIIVPSNDNYCQSLYEAYQGRFGLSENQSDWYRTIGSKELVHCLGTLSGTSTSCILIE